MSHDSKGNTSRLEELLGIDPAEFAALPPAQRTEKALRVAPDLHAFLPEDQLEPERTRELARSLLSALTDKGAYEDVGLAGLEPRIIGDGRLRSECDRDQNVYLGRIFTRFLTRAVPDLVFQPVDAKEVSAALEWAHAQKVPVTLRGAASTAMGGSVPANGGLVLDTSRLDSIEIDAGARRVAIGAGTRMRPLHRALRDEGLALPVYPSNLGGTYAGWLVTGGIGMNAFARGRALDPLLAAQIVLPDGTRVRLDADGHLDLLDEDRRLDDGEARAWWKARGCEAQGLSDWAGSEGQFGVLVQLELALEPVPELAPFLMVFRSRSEALGAVDWIVERVGAGLEAPGDLKLLTGEHVAHFERVWKDEDAKRWHEHPGACSDDRELPWSCIVSPSESGAQTGPEPDGHEHATHVFVNFLTRSAGRDFAGLLAQMPGTFRVLEHESVRIARDRFRPQQIKRLGPAMLAAEILLPAANVGPFLPQAERLAASAHLELDCEVYYLADGSALTIAGFLADHRSGSFPVDLFLGPTLLDLAMARFDGKPYVLGRWLAHRFHGKFGGEAARALIRRKQALDPRRIVNRGSFFDAGLRGPHGAVFERTMLPTFRVLRWMLGIAPWGAGIVRGVLGKFPGPAAGHGQSLGEIVPGDSPTGRAIHCVNCGECNSVCPIFNESAIRLPQTLTHLGESLHAGEPLGATGSALLDLCMRCGNCEEVCQAGIPHLPLYDTMQAFSDRERPRDRGRHVLLLERLRSSARYVRDFLDVRPGGYEKRAPAALPGEARFVLRRAESDSGPVSTCIHCGACVDVCPTQANREYEGDDPRWITTIQERCIGCGTCVEVCPANLANGGKTLRVMEAPTFDWLTAAREFAAQEEA